MKNLKKLVLAFVLATVSFSYAQVDVALNPLGALFGRPEVTGEFIVSDYFGVELGANVAFGKARGVSTSNYNPKQSGFGVKVQGKYYFSPDEGGDGWYASLYVRQQNLKIDDTSDSSYYGFKRSIFAVGLTAGKKWVFDSGVFVESALGFGRPISEKNEWLDEDGGDDFGVKLGFDATFRLAIGYRF